MTPTERQRRQAPAGGCASPLGLQKPDRESRSTPLARLASRRRFRGSLKRDPFRLRRECLQQSSFGEGHDLIASDNEVVEHTHIDKMTLSKAIRKLEEGGLVRREASSLDSRAVEVRFTPRGRKVVEQAVMAIENADDEFFSCLPGKQLADYKALTVRVIAHNG